MGWHEEPPAQGPAAQRPLPVTTSTPSHAAPRRTRQPPAQTPAFATARTAKPCFRGHMPRENRGGGGRRGRVAPAPPGTRRRGAIAGGRITSCPDKVRDTAGFTDGAGRRPRPASPGTRPGATAVTTAPAPAPAPSRAVDGQARRGGVRPDQDHGRPAPSHRPDGRPPSQAAACDLVCIPTTTPEGLACAAGRLPAGKRFAEESLREARFPWPSRSGPLSPASTAGTEACSPSAPSRPDATAGMAATASFLLGGVLRRSGPRRAGADVARDDVGRAANGTRCCLGHEKAFRARRSRPVRGPLRRFWRHQRCVGNRVCSPFWRGRVMACGAPRKGAMRRHPGAAFPPAGGGCGSWAARLRAKGRHAEPASKSPAANSHNREQAGALCQAGRVAVTMASATSEAAAR